jgi:hypothetical protein
MIEQAIDDLNQLKKLSDEFDSYWDTLQDVLSVSPESPFFEIHGRALDAALNHWSHRYGIPLENTHWFVYDNKWGLKELGALHGAVMIPITDVESFVNFELMSQKVALDDSKGQIARGPNVQD